MRAYEVQDIVAQVGLGLVDLLNLRKIPIHFHVVGRKSKYFKRMKTDMSGLCGCMFGCDSGVEIAIVYDNHRDRESVISTIIHELVHVKLHKLLSLCTIGYDAAKPVEENITQDFEKLLIGLLCASKKYQL